MSTVDRDYTQLADDTLLQCYAGMSAQIAMLQERLIELDSCPNAHYERVGIDESIAEYREAKKMMYTELLKRLQGVKNDA